VRWWEKSTYDKHGICLLASYDITHVCLVGAVHTKSQLPPHHSSFNALSKSKKEIKIGWLFQGIIKVAHSDQGSASTNWNGRERITGPGPGEALRVHSHIHTYLDVFPFVLRAGLEFGWMAGWRDDGVSGREVGWAVLFFLGGAACPSFSFVLVTHRLLDVESGWMDGWCFLEF
jgi:hypothetical protein